VWTRFRFLGDTGSGRWVTPGLLLIVESTDVVYDGPAGQRVVVM
jgi:hypothetical protein